MQQITGGYFSCRNRFQHPEMSGRGGGVPEHSPGQVCQSPGGPRMFFFGEIHWDVHKKSMEKRRFPWNMNWISMGNGIWMRYGKYRNEME